MQWGTPMFGNVTAVVGLHLTREYWTKHGAGWDLVEKEFQSENLLATNFTTQHDLYW